MQETAEAMAGLARSGFKVNEVTSAMPGLLTLASASNMDLGRASEITANILRGFGKEADEAGSVADILAKGAATANLDVEGLGASMSTVAPVAHSLGVEFEDVAAATGIMADAGIQGEKGGRMLRQGMLRLSKPTGEAGDLIEELGINVFDADGNMKSMDKVVGELEKGLKGQNKQQRAAALSTIFGSESTAGWTTLIDKGSDALGDYIVELENSEGAAQNMADTMQDTAQGQITRMESAISGLKIELGEKLLPIIGDVAGGVADFAEKLANMDEATIETIAETALLVTALLGVTTAVAGIVAAVGAFMAFAGPVGIAITAGTLLFGGLMTAIHLATKETDESIEVNLDHARSLKEQADSLENSADTFDKLSDKAKISNEQLGLMYDLHKRMEDAGNKDELAKLTKQYDKLAEQSGLSKDEIKELFEANENIVEQSDDVDTAIGKSGEAWAKNTEAVRDYIAEMRRSTLVEMERERENLLKEELRLKDKILSKEKDIAKEEERYEELYRLSEENAKGELVHKDDILGRMEEIDDLLQNSLDLDLDREALAEEYNDLKNIEEGYSETLLDAMEDLLKVERDSLETSKEDLKLTRDKREGFVDMYLDIVGINEAGEEGLVILEKNIAKNDEIISNLDEELGKNGELTEKQQKKYDKAVEQNEEYRKTQDLLQEEFSVYGSINSLIDSQLSQLDDSTRKKLESLEKTHDIEIAEGNIYDQVKKKNEEYEKEIEKLKESKKQHGANKDEIDKQIGSLEDKIGTSDAILLKILDEAEALELVADGYSLNSEQLESYLEEVGFSAEDAKAIAKQLADDTVEIMESGVDGTKAAGGKTTEAFGDGIESTKDKSNRTTKSVVDESIAEFKKGKDDVNKAAIDKGESYRLGTEATKQENIGAVRDIIDGSIREFKQGDSDTKKGGESKGKSHAQGLFGTQKNNTGIAGSLSTSVTRILSRTSDGGGGRKAGTNFATGIRGRATSVNKAGESVAKSGRGGLGSVSTSTTGANFVSGFSSAISSRTGVGSSIWNVASSLGRSALSGLRSSIKTASPSKETYKTGEWFTQGFTGGIEEEERNAIQQAVHLAKETHGAMEDELDRLANSFHATNFALQANREVLTVQHEINNSSLENKLGQLESTVSTLTDALITMSKVQHQQTQQIIERDIIVEMDTNEVGRSVKDTVTNEQYNDTDRRLHYAGIKR